MTEIENLNLLAKDAERPGSPFEAERDIRAQSGGGASQSSGSSMSRGGGGGWPPGPGDGLAAADNNIMHRWNLKILGAHGEDAKMFLFAFILPIL